MTSYLLDPLTRFIEDLQGNALSVSTWQCVFAINDTV